MSEKIRPPVSTNMHRWGSELARISKENGLENYKEMIESLQAPRSFGWRGVEILGLPHVERQVTPAHEFVERFDSYISRDNHLRWFISLDAKDGLRELPRFRRPMMLREDILPSITEHARNTGTSLDEYEVTWNKDYEQEYGGNIHVSVDGTIAMEFCRGPQGSIAGGAFDHEEHTMFRVTKNLKDHAFQYSFDDERLRELVYTQVLRHIPTQGTGAHVEFFPGYYEFALIRKEVNGPLEPVFLDYRSDAVFSDTPPLP